MVVAFAGLIGIGTALLSLPIALDDTASPHSWIDSLFWATSASTVTGLATTPVEDFSLFGEIVMLLLIQVGGFGIMTIGSVLAIVAFRRIGVRQRLLAQTEIGAIDVGELRSLISSIARVTVIVEAAVAVVLFVQLALVADNGVARSMYSALFHAVSAFNNAGIALSSDSLVSSADDPLVVLPVSVAFILGGLGFPVIVELRRRLRRHQWSLHTKITLAVTACLVLVGPALVLAGEWTNPATLGDLSWWDKVQAAWFQGVTPRTAGFNTVDIGGLREPTIGVLTVLMFVGAGPASTSGGIKVTTLAILFAAARSEIRGHRDVEVFRRRIPDRTVRQAITVAVLSAAMVFVSAVTLVALSPFHLTDTLFEAASAFGTVGLSTGITGALPRSGHVILVVVMLTGRVGPVTFVTALAMRGQPHRYRFAEERPIIG